MNTDNRLKLNELIRATLNKLHKNMVNEMSTKDSFLAQDSGPWEGWPFPYQRHDDELFSTVTYGYDCVAFAEKFLDLSGSRRGMGPRSLPQSAQQSSFKSLEERCLAKFELNNLILNKIFVIIKNFVTVTLKKLQDVASNC